MKKTNLFLISSSALAMGLIMYLAHHEIILVSKTTLTPKIQAHVAQCNTIKLYYWHHERWHIETDTIIQTTHRVSDIYQLITHWFLYAREFDTIPLVSVQAVTLAPNQTLLYLSLDKSPFKAEWSLFEKWMFMEGLLHTISFTFPSIKELCILKNHAAFIDRDLDFSQPWPISGFLNTQLQ